MRNSITIMQKSNRRKFLGTAAALAAGTAVAAMPMPAAGNKYPVVHHVFFWLKNPNSKEDLEKLLKKEPIPFGGGEAVTIKDVLVLAQPHGALFDYLRSLPPARAD